MDSGVKPMNDVSKSRPAAPPPSGGRAAEQDHSSAPEHEPISPRKALIGVVVILIVAVVLAVAGILPRQSAKAALRQHTDATAAPYVIALPAEAGASVDSFVLPGNVTAYTDS